MELSALNVGAALLWEAWLEWLLCGALLWEAWLLCESPDTWEEWET